MIKYILLISLALSLLSCEDQPKMSSTNEISWSKRAIDVPRGDSLINGKSYLSVYSEIYSRTENTTHSLTATVSIRNINIKDTIFVNAATYYDTHGNRIRDYFKKTIYVAPLETVEIIIDRSDKQGGTGANFIFDWTTKKTSSEPYFEAVMISTSGQQGLSFTTQGKRIN